MLTSKSGMWAVKFGHRRDLEKRPPPPLRLGGPHAPCSPGNSAYIVSDIGSGDGSQVGRADRLSAMDTDDASDLVQLVSFSFYEILPHLE